VSILKVNQIQDRGGNTLLTSDGAGTISSGGAITNTPSFFVRKTTAQSIGDSTYTTIEYDDVIYDTHSAFSTST